VVEISSFMAFAIRQYRSDYTILTNLKPDHLNWHTSLQGYMDAKMNLIHHTIKKSVINQQLIEFAQYHHLSLDMSENVEIFTQNDANTLDISGTHFS
jgi:UDP-N-acetylmuramoylalanine--D-glutamate ligase